MSSTLDDSMSVLPGESGSVAEILGSSESLTSHSGSTEPADSASAIALTAAFHFTGTSASANGATMQECFLQSVVSSAQQYELLITRLRGLSREWTEFCDQEISLQLGSDDRSDTTTANSTRTIAGAQNTVSTAAHTTSPPSVNTRIRRSLLPSMQFADRCLSVLRYLGAVETDKLVSRRSCLEVPVTGPLLQFLQELGFEPEFTYVAEGLMFIRGRVKVCVYTVNEVTQFDNSPITADCNTSVLDPLPKEWRRICPRSWLVEISSVGSPADESLRDEVSDFADLLFPLVIPNKVDHSLFVKK